MKAGVSHVLLIVVLCLAGSLAGYLASRADNPHHQLIMTLESSLPVETELFYDTGRGFNEQESVRKVLYQANVPVTLPYDLHVENLKGLRFDPSRSPARIRIHEIILQYQGRKPFAVPLDSVTGIKDIKSLHYDGRALTVETTETAQDPMLLLGRIGPAPRPSVTRMILFMLIGAVVASGVAFFVLWVYRNSVNSIKFR